jgi:hypothetical protein
MHDAGDSDPDAAYACILASLMRIQNEHFTRLPDAGRYAHKPWLSHCTVQATMDTPTIRKRLIDSRRHLKFSTLACVFSCWKKASMGPLPPESFSAAPLRLALAYARKLEASALLVARRHRYAIKKAVRADMSTWMEAIAAEAQGASDKADFHAFMPLLSD